MKAEKIAEFLEGKLFGDSEIEILRVASLNAARENEIAFVEQAENLSETNASALLVPENFDTETPIAFIKVENPKLAFAKISALLHPPKKRAPEIHPSAVISESAKIGKDVFIGAFCCVGDDSEIGDGTNLRAGAKVGDNVRVGDNCTFHPNVFIEDNCSIGDKVILHSGVCDRRGRFRLCARRRERLCKISADRNGDNRRQCGNRREHLH